MLIFVRSTLSLSSHAFPWLLGDSSQVSPLNYVGSINILFTSLHLKHKLYFFQFPRFYCHNDFGEIQNFLLYCVIPLLMTWSLARWNTCMNTAFKHLHVSQGLIPSVVTI
jgi:hypothetical protein